MVTVADILDAAKKLRPEELQELRGAIDQLARTASAIAITVNKISYRLLRLEEAAFRTLLGRSLAIEDDYWFLIQLFQAERVAGEELTFALVYLTLKELTGESSRFFDDYKGSFSFPFRLDIHKEGRRLDYLLEVRNHRDSLYFHVRKVVAPDDKRLKDHAIHPPFTEEWSREEINKFIAYLHGYISGYWTTRGRGRHKPFVHAIASSLIVYGFCDGESFEHEYSSSEAVEVQANEGVAVLFQEMSEALAKRLHDSGACLGCSWYFHGDEAEDYAPDLTARGLFSYSHLTENWISGPYGQVRRPAQPIHVDQLPPRMRKAVKTMRFDSLSFAETPYVQPIEHAECVSWESAYLDVTGKHIRPIPGKEEEYVDYCEELGDVGDNIEVEPPPGRQPDSDEE